MSETVEYLNRMEQALVEILKSQKHLDKTITIWWGLDGLRLNEDGTLEWIRRDDLGPNRADGSDALSALYPSSKQFLPVGGADYETVVFYVDDDPIYCTRKMLLAQTQAQCSMCHLAETMADYVNRQQYMSAAGAQNVASAWR